jgi:hypothetical protein
MATTVAPVARAATAVKISAEAKPAPQDPQQTRPREVGVLPRNPSAISAEHDRGDGDDLFSHRTTPGLHAEEWSQGLPGPASLLLKRVTLLPLQFKLVIGPSHDPLESEADAMAERVMQAKAAPVAGSAAPAVVLRRASAAVTSTEAPPSVHNVLRAPGQALDTSTRSFMESQFGQDFSGVRIHSDAAAAESAQVVQAHAYTLGNNVVFASGKYDPASSEGRRLLAHELTHTIQQQTSCGQKSIQRDEDADKKAAEAARVAHLVQEYDTELEKARTSGDWQTVAEKLNGFSPEDIEQRLGQLTPAEVKSMHDGAVANHAAGPNSNAATLSVPGWSDGTKWNRGVQSVSQVRRIPVQGLREGNQDQNADKAKTAETAEGRAIVLIPEGLDLTKPVEVLLFLHGHNIGYRQRSATTTDPGTVRDVENDRMEEQIKASKRPMIGILPQGTEGSDFGGKSFNSDTYIADVFRVLSSLGAFGDKPAPQVSSVIFGGHSGAGGPIADILGEKGQPRLSSKVGEVALFDAINGPIELGQVANWVRERLNHDVSELTKPGITPDQQKAYLQTSMRFRAYHTETDFYKPRHEQLKAFIENWLVTNAAAKLGGKTSDVYTALHDNYQVISVGHSDHDHILGLGNRLLDAVNNLPHP